MIIAIASPDDPRIASYRSLRERDMARTQGLVWIEGQFTLERLADAGRFAVESVLLAEPRLTGLSATLDRLPVDAPVFVAPQAVLDAIAGFDFHRGVIALARRPPSTTANTLLAALPDGRALVLALAGVSNHDNIGACFRNASAFGVQAVVLDAASADPLYRKAMRVSVGAALHLPFAHGGSDADLLQALDRGGFETWALTPRGGEVLQRLAPPGRVAVMLGAEGSGLSPGLLARARRVSIPMEDRLDSLNVATAGAIALAHIHAARKLA